jgi:serine phosphatase RsbU (regulator of sigma subunit)
MAEVDTGNVLVMLTDGLLEYNRMDGNSYGYRFARLVEEKADLTAKDLGEAIVADRRTHSADEEHCDDALLIAITVRDRYPYLNENANATAILT